jgi:PPP family 3-phenylpropionic acid transporter
MGICRTKTAEFSYQKLYGNISKSIAPLFAGVMMDWLSRGRVGADFRVVFYQFAVTQILAIFIVGFLEQPATSGKKSKGDSSSALFKNPAVLAFCVVAFLGGAYKSFGDSFCVLYLKQLGASNSLFGLRGTIAGISGTVFTFLAGFITQKYGNAAIFAAAICLQGVRLLVFSTFQDPYYILPIEASEGVYLVLFLVSMTTYCGKIAPPSLLSSLHGVVWGLFFGLGRAGGSLIGGILISYLGNIATFRVLSVVALTAGVTYFLLYNSWLKHVEPKNDDGKTETNNRKKH